MTDLASTAAPHEMRHGARARLRFLDEQAFWEGRVNRADLMDRFGVSVPQATNDLSRYQELAPDNLAYDKRAKAYLTTQTFVPVFGAPSAEGWLHRHAVQSGPGDLIAEELPLPRRALDPWLVRRVVSAKRVGRMLRVLYQTMEPTEPEPAWRWVTPMAFASDGLRWHLRAYNHDAARHEDLVFPRIFEIGEERASESVPADLDWETLVVVRLRPAAALSPSQQRAVAIDFQMEGGVAEIPVRAAMLFNFVRRMRLDRGGRLIEIENIVEIESIMEQIQAFYSQNDDIN